MFGSRIAKLEKRVAELEKENRDLSNRLETYSDIVLGMRREFSDELYKTINDYVEHRVVVQSVCNMEAYNKGKQIKKILEEEK